MAYKQVIWLGQIGLGTVQQVQRLRKKEIHCKGGRGGLWAMSYFYRCLGDVDFTKGQLLVIVHTHCLKKKKNTMTSHMSFQYLGFCWTHL